MSKKRKKTLKTQSPPRIVVGTANQTIRFSPTAWAKLLFLRDYSDTEVGGFAVAAKDDLLFVEDVQLVKQVCSWAHVAFDDESVADFYDRQVDEGRQPEQFARIWIHTHPGDCPRPSMIDEKTFDRVFCRSDWAVMFILASEGQTYARLRFNVGPRADVEIPVSMDYSRSFDGCNVNSWEQEYLESVQLQKFERTLASNLEPVLASPFDDKPPYEWYDGWRDYVADENNVKGFIS